MSDALFDPGPPTHQPRPLPTVRVALECIARLSVPMDPDRLLAALRAVEGIDFRPEVLHDPAMLKRAIGCLGWQFIEDGSDHDLDVLEVISVTPPAPWTLETLAAELAHPTYVPIEGNR